MSSAVRSESTITTHTTYVSEYSSVDAPAANNSDEMIAGDPTEFARWFQEQLPAITSTGR